MKDEINKIIQSRSDFYKLDNALKYYLGRHKAQILLDYITNLQEENERLNNIKEEKKIPEKLNLDKDELRGKETPRAIDYLIESKINQVIDYLKSKGE